MRMYKLGDVLREKYNEFLGPDYNINDLYSVSTNSNRMKVSLLLVLASLYPPSLSTYQKWHNTLDWTPIAPEFLPIEKDFLFQGLRCNKYVHHFLH